MNSEQFEREMYPLVKVFGAKYYPDERKFKIFESLKTLQDFQFRKVVSNLIQNSRVAPLGAEFQAAASSFLEASSAKKRESLDEQVSKLPACLKCDNSGIVMAHSRCKMKYKYAFKCDCKAGILRNYKLPFFTLEKWPDLVLRGS